MKIAIPLVDSKLALHFGHCRQFAIIEVDVRTKKIIGREDLTPPEHEPGVLPRWLAEHEVNLIIAGGIGMRAQALFAERDIQVAAGASSETPEKLVNDYLAGELKLGQNYCDH